MTRNTFNQIIMCSDCRYFELVRDVRQNKGSILKASVDYIKKLKIDQERKNILEQKSRKIEFQNKKLILKLRVSSSRNIMQRY